jgi:hypothetical protein
VPLKFLILSKEKKKTNFFWRRKVYQIAGVETKILPRKNMSENKN